MCLLLVGTLFCCSSKPTGGAGGSFGQENTFRSGHINHKGMTVPSDWMCIICGCVNFARRTSCFQVLCLFLSPFAIARLFIMLPLFFLGEIISEFFSLLYTIVTQIFSCLVGYPEISHKCLKVEYSG